MLEALIESLIIFSLAIWWLKSMVDALEYRRVSNLHKNGLGLVSGVDHGMEIERETGKSTATERPVVRVE